MLHRLNLSKGLFRAWVAITAAWLILVTGLVLYAIVEGDGELELTEWLSVSVVPPLLLGLLGFLVHWTICGYRGHEKVQLKRGLLRTWTALSAIWSVGCIIVAGISYLDIHKEYTHIAPDEAYYNTKTNEIYWSIHPDWRTKDNLVDNRFFEYSPANPCSTTTDLDIRPPKFRDPNSIYCKPTVWDAEDQRKIVELDNGASITVAPIDGKNWTATPRDKSILQQMYDELVARDRNIIQKRESEAISALIAKWILISTAFPIALLVLGGLIAWIVQGFRR